MQFAKKPKNPSKSKAAIFVHGFLGNRNTWDKWPDLLAQDKRAADIDVYVVEYDSASNYVSHWAEQLCQLLSAAGFDSGKPHNHLYFIAHSMGAAVVRQAWLNASSPHQSSNPHWAGHDHHDFVFFAPAHTGCKNILMIEGRPSGTLAFALSSLGSLLEFKKFNGPAYNDLSGRTTFLTNLAKQKDKFKPALRVFQADSDIVVNTRPFREDDRLQVLPYTNHTTITKCESPSEDTYMKFWNALDEPQGSASPLNVLERLDRIFLYRSGAYAAAQHIVLGRRYFADDRSAAISKLMRDHSAEGVSLLGEQVGRDLLDALCEYYSLVEVAIRLQLIDPLWWRTFTERNVRILANDFFATYYGKTYPIPLVKALANRFRVFSEGEFIATPEIPPYRPEHGASFSTLLEVRERIENSPEIQYLFRLIDGFTINGQRIETFLDSQGALTKKQKIEFERMLMGVASLFDQLDDLFDLNEASSDKSVFQAQILALHIYWLKLLAPHKDQFLQLLESTLQKRSDEFGDFSPMLQKLGTSLEFWLSQASDN